MSKTDYANKLTSAGKETLSELMQSFRDEILASSVRKSVKSNGEISEISARDVIEGYNAIITKPSRLFLSKYIPIISLLSSSITFSILFIALSNFEVFFKYRTYFIIAGMISSYVVILGTIVFYIAERRLRSLRYSKKSDHFTKDPYESFILQWIEIENYIRAQISLRLGDSQTIGSIPAMIRKLENLRVLSHDDSNFLIEAIKLRNAAVHGGPTEDSEIYAKYRKKMTEFMQKISDSKQII
jgi:hypothetical protein